MSCYIYDIAGSSSTIVDSRMNLHDHLLASKERVANKLSSSQRNRLLAIGHDAIKIGICELGILNGVVALPITYEEVWLFVVCRCSRCTALTSKAWINCG